MVQVRGRLQSAIPGATAKHYIGNGWGNDQGGGIRIEIKMRFDPTNTNIAGAFGVYLFSAPNIYDVDATGDGQWPGQAPGYGHFAEFDMFELAGFMPDNSYNGKHTFQGTVHDFSGTYDQAQGWQYHIYNANSLQDIGAPPDWTQFHIVSIVLVPAVGGDLGYVQWSF